MYPPTQKSSISVQRITAIKIKVATRVMLVHILSQKIL
jgi:hypothetical protein